MNLKESTFHAIKEFQLKQELDFMALSYNYKIQNTDNSHTDVWYLKLPFFQSRIQNNSITLN